MERNRSDHKRKDDKLSGHRNTRPIRCYEIDHGLGGEEIFRNSPCAVLTVGPNVCGEPETLSDMRTILCPIDFRPESLAAIPYATSLAEQDRARLYLLYVFGGAVMSCRTLLSRLLYARSFRPRQISGANQRPSLNRETREKRSSNRLLNSVPT